MKRSVFYCLKNKISNETARFFRDVKQNWTGHSVEHNLVAAAQGLFGFNIKEVYITTEGRWGYHGTSIQRRAKGLAKCVRYNELSLLISIYFTITGTKNIVLFNLPRVSFYSLY